MPDEHRAHGHVASLTGCRIEVEVTFGQLYRVSLGVRRLLERESERYDSVQAVASTETEGNHCEPGRQCLDDLSIEIVCEFEGSPQQGPIRGSESGDEIVHVLTAPRNEVRHRHALKAADLFE